MQVARGLLICVGLLAVAPANAAQTSPIGKVISMLHELQQKNEEATKEQEVNFAKFQTWATTLIGDLDRQIEKNQAIIDQNAATEAEGNALSNKMNEEVAQHEADIARQRSDIAAMTDVRGKEKADYAATLTDYNESIDAIGRAIGVLREHEASTAQAEFLQKVATLKRIPVETKAAIQSYLQQPASLDDYSAPEAHAYEFQSGGIVNMLKKLQDDFEGERRALQQQEADAQHNYEMEKQTLDDEIELGTQEVGRKSKRGAKAKAEAAAAAGAETDEKNQKAENVATREQTKVDLAARTKENAEMLEFTEGERVAVNKAIEILESSDVAGNASSKGSGEDIGLGYKLFVQVATSLSQSPDAKQAVVDFLRNAGKSQSSTQLTMLAMKVNENPFGKVMGMIKDLVQKLQDEAREEAEQKGWCTGELKANKITRDDKTASVEDLNERLNESNALIAQLNEEVANLEADVAEMEKAMAERTQQRQTESKTNAVTIEESKAGAAATTQAMAVLKEFYEANSPPTASPAVADHASAGGDVMSFLEVVITDFNREESETTLREKMDQDDFEKFMQEGKVSNAAKSASADGKREQAKRESKTAEDTKKDIASTQKELDAANAYYEKLKPTCVDDGMSYEERVKAREAEITSLKEALELLK